nr:H-NS histone family protein [uncultured Roseovarius sp.]
MGKTINKNGTWMSQINLKNMSMSELRALEKRVSRAIASREKIERKEALAALKTKAKQLGYSLGELVGDAKSDESVKAPKPAKQRKPVAAKYRNPENPSQTWAGRGRQPKWIKDAIASGKSIESFAIKS